MGITIIIWETTLFGCHLQGPKGQQPTQAACPALSAIIASLIKYHFGNNLLISMG